jgi:amidase
MEGQTLPPYTRESDIDAIGPLARSARDLEIAFKTIAGPDADDAAGWQLRLPRAPDKTWRQWRVAALLDAPNAEVDRSVQDRLQTLAQFLARQGAKVDDRARPAIDLAEAHEVFIRLLRAATARGLSDETFALHQEAARQLRPGEDSYYAWMVQANTMSHRDWLYLNEKRHRMRLKWAEFFREYDLLLCPPAATPAFPHNQQGERWERMVTVNGKPQPSTTQMFWAGYSGMCYLPSTVAPAGFSAGLPVGVQIVGPQYGDLTCLAFAQLLERDYQSFVAPPGYD